MENIRFNGVAAVLLLMENLLEKRVQPFPMFESNSSFAVDFIEKFVCQDWELNSQPSFVVSRSLKPCPCLAASTVLAPLRARILAVGYI